MNRIKRQLLFVLSFFFVVMHGQVIVTKWSVNTTGKLASYWENTNGSPTSPSFSFHTTTDTADVQRVCYSADSVWVRSTGMTDNMGKFLNPGQCSTQTFVYCFPRNPVVPGTKTSAPASFAVGALLNGVPIYGRGAGTSWSVTANVNGGPQIWNTEVYLSEGFVLDTAFGAHPQQQGQYHTHAKPYRMYEATSLTVHSPIIGFAFDGYPVYGPYGYSTATNSASAVTRMKSGYSLRNITVRHTLPDGTSLSASSYGPNVSVTYPLGTYCEDYEWLAANAGDLDAYNGRFCVTPEYPGGTYAYFVTLTSAGVPQYPYYIGPQYYGTPNSGNLNGGCLRRVFPSSGLTGCYTPTVSASTITLSLVGSSSITCNGLSTGSATISATGGSGTLTYSWSPSGGTAATASSLSAGTYTCAVTDGTTTNTQIVTIAQASAITASISGSSSVTCNAGANGSATVNASGGTGAYTYSWSPAGGTSSAVTTFSAGTYTCTIKDANQCSKTQTVTINQPGAVTPGLVGSSSVTCNGGANGSATVSASGGTGAYTYSWSPAGGTTSAVTTFTVGTYTCTIKDANQCVKTQTVFINQPSPVTPTLVGFSNVSCSNGTNGSATVSANGGTGAYTYSWSPVGGTASAVATFSAGTYTCTIKDANQCSKTQTVTITQPVVITANISSTATACSASTGIASVSSVSGGNGAYTYSWLPSGGTASTATGLGAGSYSCAISDASLCTVTKTISITTANGPTLTAPSQTNVACNGGTTGAASVNVTGGTAPYTYSWAPATSSTNSVNSLSSGNYTCYVTDANSCSAIQIFVITQPAASLNASVSATSILCSGNNATVTVSASGGTSAYTGTGTFVVSVGSYTYAVTDANSCSSTTSINITQPAALTVSLAGSANASCNGFSNGSAIVSASGGTGAYTYSWLPAGGTASSVATFSAGTYTCTIKDANSCAKTQTVTITQPVAITANISSTATACSGSTGIAGVSGVAGGNGTYSYSWSPSGGTGATASGLGVGAYTCAISDASLCTVTKTISIATANNPSLTSFSQTNVACYSNSTGIAAVNPATGGTSPYTYSWSPVASANTSVTGLVAGTYTARVTDANNCFATQTFVITQPATVLNASVSATSILCNGNSATVIVSANGGTSAYTGTGTFAVAAGTYTYPVTDANGCSASTSISITQPAALTVSLTGSANASCNGFNNGSATVSATGGTGAYTYSWLPVGGTASAVTTFSVGTYTCTIKDVNSCAKTQTVTITQPNAITANISSTATACSGSTGIANVSSVAGGNSVYTYSWSPSGGAAATASNLGTGNYTCTIKDGNLCSTTKTISISTTSNPTLTAASQTNVSCNSGSNGVAVVNPATGGTSPYTYSWSPNINNATTAASLTAGTYTSRVTDANGCFAIQTFVITQPASVLSTTANATTILCNGSNATVTVLASGGTSAYTGTGTFAVAAGSYTYPVTDANGCSSTSTLTISQPAAIGSTLSTSSSVTCNGGNSGSATITASGGTGVYTYSWLPGGGTASSASSLLAGTYTCIIKDANQCSKTQTVTITEPTAITVSLSGSSNISCNGSANGSASVSASGGTGAYTYSWLPNGGAVSSASSLLAGTYTCLIKDANQCSKTQTVTITEPTAITASMLGLSNISCNGSANGSATVNSGGGTGAYTYSWSPSGGTASSATSLLAGTYTCIIKDANLCSKTQTVTITEPTALTTSLSGSSNISCNGGANGSATVNATGGTGAYTYSWSPTGGTASSASLLLAGTYTCTVKDANLCSKTQTVTLTQPAAITASLSGSSNISCNGGTNGSATVTATGGAGAYTYSWSPNGGTASSASALLAGTYTCTIKDASLCTKTQTVIITEPSAITTSIVGSSNVSCNGGSNGSATVVASGGTGSYTYSWTPGNSAAASAASLASGIYTCTIKDANQCSKTQTLLITQPGVLVVNSSATSILCNGGNAVVTVTAGGGTSAYTGTGTFTVSAGTHTYLVSDANGCTATSSLVVTQPAAIASSQTLTLCSGQALHIGSAVHSVTGVYTDTLQSINGCDSTVTSNLTINDAIDISTTINGQVITSGANGASYQWLDCDHNNMPVPNQTNQSFTPLASGHYAVIVTKNNCSDTSICVNMLVTGIVKNTSDKNLSIYPNPATNLVTITTGSSEQGTLIISNSVGQVVYTLDVESDKMIIDISSYQNGIYFIQLHTDNGIITRSIIKSE